MSDEKSVTDESESFKEVTVDDLEHVAGGEASECELAIQVNGEDMKVKCEE